MVPLLGTARVATVLSFELAECPTWDPIRGVLLWVDILEGTVFRGAIGERDLIEIQDRIAFPEPTGMVAASEAGELVVAGRRGLFYLSLQEQITRGPEVNSIAGRRFNDGKPDPTGRLVVGTAGPRGSRTEVLCRFELNGHLTVLDDDLTLANGIGWTTDGHLLYTVDTFNRRIYVREYEPGSGHKGTRRTLVSLDGPGVPDGMTVDTEDHLWVAVWGEGSVVRISPSGEVVGRIAVPTPHVSSVTFAGPELDVMVITTAREGLTPDELEAFPLSGCLFTARPGVRGPRPYMWAGKPTTPLISMEESP